MEAAPHSSTGYWYLYRADKAKFHVLYCAGQTRWSKWSLTDLKSFFL